MLPTAARIRRRPEFTSVLRGGTRAARGGVVVHWSSSESGSDSLGTHQNVSQPPLLDTGSARAGFVVSKAVGNAVVRNRVKRRLRHIVRDHIGQWPVDTDVVVRATPRSAERSFWQLADDFAAAAESARRKYEHKRQLASSEPSHGRSTAL